MDHRVDTALDAGRALGAWEMPEELRMLRETARRFMKERVLPEEDKLQHDAYTFPADILNRLQAKARKLGLWCVRTPAEYGGAGLNLLAQAWSPRRRRKCRMGAYVPACGAFGFDPPNVIYKGTQAQIEKYAVPVVGERRQDLRRDQRALRRLRPGARDPDPAPMRDGDHYVLNGTKIWITGARQADWGIVFARTGASRAAAASPASSSSSDRRG